MAAMALMLLAALWGLRGGYEQMPLPWALHCLRGPIWGSLCNP